MHRGKRKVTVDRNDRVVSLAKMIMADTTRVGRQAAHPTVRDSRVGSKVIGGKRHGEMRLARAERVL